MISDEALSAAAERAAMQPWQRHLMNLKAAELDEVAFVRALNALKADKSIKKADF
jgi:hypothetical protein